MSLRGTKQSHGSIVALYSMRLPRRAYARSRFAPRNDIVLLGSLCTYLNPGCYHCRDF
jgi:hypothetical protein